MHWSKNSFSYIRDVVCFTSVYYINTKLEILSKSLVRPRRVNCLVTLREYRRKVSFPMTHRYIAQFRSQTESYLRLPTCGCQLCGCQLALLSPERVGILALSVFSKYTTALYAKCGDRTSTLRLLFGVLTN